MGRIPFAAPLQCDCNAAAGTLAAVRRPQVFTVLFPKPLSFLPKPGVFLHYSKMSHPHGWLNCFARSLAGIPYAFVVRRRAT